MKKLLERILICIAAAGIVSLSSCDDGKNGSEDNTFKGLKFTSAGTINLSLEHMFGNKALAYSPDSFFTQAGDTLKVLQVAYYISNITLEKTSGEKINLGTYHLIDEGAPATKMLSIANVPAGTYSKISFMLGVDSVRNHTGVQEGALDPAYGMFWTWNTGYIFFRLKGRIGLDATAISFDIGGDGNGSVYTSDLNAFMLEGNKFTLKYKLDLAELFKGPHILNLRNEPKEIHTSTETVLLPRMVQNMKDMFTLTAVN